MSIAFHVGLESWPIGSDSLLTAFFATVAVRLEGGAWGSRFPVVMRELYSGRLSPERTEAARYELADIGTELAGLRPADAIWDVERLDWRPAWAAAFDASIESLADYFVTSDGRLLLAVRDDALDSAAAATQELEIG